MNDQTLLVAPSSDPVISDRFERVIITLTKNHNPAYWESGGGSTNTGKATIVTDRFYQPLPALYIRRKGSLSNDNHALLPLKKGYKIIQVSHHRKDFDIVIHEVKSIEGNTAMLERMSKFSAETQRYWRDQLFADAITAGMKKATDYHCKTPYFIQH